MADALLVSSPLLVGALLVARPSAPLIAVAIWWVANTSAHNFIHRPFFALPAANRAYSLLLTMVMGVPQDVWRDRHLAHHANGPWMLQLTPQLALETAALASLWTALAVARTAFVLAVYSPGLALGLALCAIQGHYEHAHGTTSHYGRLYNLLCFNDGYHAEHHAYPGVDWRALPSRFMAAERVSGWPPLLRWLDVRWLDALEHVVLRSPLLQRVVLRVHRRAFERLLPLIAQPSRVAIVGGGLFPRTAMILRDLLPSAAIVVVDASATSLDHAHAWLPPGVRVECRTYPGPADRSVAPPYDLVVIPLAFDGNREDVYAHARMPTIVHDWMWRPRGQSARVSLLLLKRLNLVLPRR